MGTVTKPIFGQLNLAHPQSWANLVHVGVTPRLATRMETERDTAELVRATNRIWLYEHAIQHPVLKYFPKVIPEKIFKDGVSENQKRFLAAVQNLAQKYPAGSLPENVNSAHQAILGASQGYNRADFATLALFFSHRGNKPQALGAFEFLARNENNGASYFKLGEEAVRSQDFGLALTAFEKAFDLDPTLEETQYQIGLIFYKSDHIETAKRYFLRTLALNPQHEQAWHLLVASLAKEGQVEQAIRAAKKHLATTPSQKQQSYTCFTLAQLYKAKGDSNQAMEFYLKAHELNPESFQPIFAYVGLLVELGKVDAAQKALLHLIEEHPKKPELHLELSKIYLKTGEVEKAHAVKEVAIALSPMPLSSQLQNFSRTVDAQMVPHLKLKLVQNPNDSITRQDLAEISIEFKQYQDAFTHYHVLKKLDPVRAEQVLDQLVQLPDLVDHDMYVREVSELKVRESLA